MAKPASIGERLRAERKRRGLLQEDIERLTGVSQGEISRIERGERQDPGWSVVKQLERGLGISFDYPEPHPSFVRFLEDPLGKKLNLSPEDEAALGSSRWFGGDDDPTPDEWYDFARIRLAMRKRKT